MMFRLRANFVKSRFPRRTNVWDTTARVPPISEKVREPETASPTRASGSDSVPEGTTPRRVEPTARRETRALPAVQILGGHRPPLQKKPAFCPKRKCRMSTWGCHPAFRRCAAKTELCVTVVFSEPRLLSLSRSSRHVRRFLCGVSRRPSARRHNSKFKIRNAKFRSLRFLNFSFCLFHWPQALSP